MPTSGSLHSVGDEIARLERVPHPVRAHADAVANTDGAKLIAYKPCIYERLLDALAKTEKVFVASL